MQFTRLGYLDAVQDVEGADVIVVGMPYDRTASFRAGSRFATDAIRRAAADGIEEYDPILKLDLGDVTYADPGDLYAYASNGPRRYVEAALDALAELPAATPIVGVGGEHTVSYPLVQHALKTWPDLGVIVFDAHTDLREDYEGSRFSHACVTRRIADLIGPKRVAMFGIRSGLQDEFDYATQNGLLHDLTPEGFSAALTKLGNRPLYITVDLDGFDPTECPGTGTPEPGGFYWKDFTRAITQLLDCKVIGGDVVELLPENDPSRRSDVLAARVVRMLLLLATK